MPRLVLPGSLVATGTTTKRTSTPSTIRTMPMPARTMDERRTDNSASSDSEHHTLPDRGSAGIEGADVVLLSHKFAKHHTCSAGGFGEGIAGRLHRRAGGGPHHQQN